jgi:hypothetical protein
MLPVMPPYQELMPPSFMSFLRAACRRSKDRPEWYVRCVENALWERYDLWSVGVKIRVKGGR